MTNTPKYSLADRPKWWLPKLMKWVSVITAVLALVMWVGSLILESLDVYALNSAANEEDSVALNFSYLADEVMWGAIAILFYAVVFWMLAVAVDKLDQLVWLNATDADRDFILQKRNRKNAKN